MATPNFSISSIQSIGKSCKKTEITTQTSNNYQTSIYGYTPLNVKESASLVKTTNTHIKKITTDNSLIVIPANSIIDRVEFFGVNNFNTKGVFNIGLGQLNGNILNLLVENATIEIANERHGGCVDFVSLNTDGNNAKNLVLVNSFVNINVETPITAGYLLVQIIYHTKPNSR